MPLEKKPYQNLSVSSIKIYAICLTIISALIGISTSDIINRDGILYIKAAQSFLNSGFSAVLHIYKWPLYPILIAITSKSLFISLEWAAYLWNIIFSVIIVWTFLSIIREIEPSSNFIIIISAIVIIGHPRFHHWQKYITRDMGYWSFLMLSLYSSIRSIKEWKYAFFGLFFLYLAFLFRIEGILFIFLYPLVAITRKEDLSKRVKKILLLYSINFVIVGFILGICYLKGFDIFKSTRLNEIFLQINLLQKNFLLKIHEKGDLISNIVLPQPSKKWGETVLVFGLFGIFIYKLINVIWPLHFFIVIFSIWKKEIMSTRIHYLIYGFLAIAGIIPLYFLYLNFFLSYRFLMPFCLGLLLFVPFSLKLLYIKSTKSSKIVKLGCIIIFIIFGLLFAGSFKPSKRDKLYIKKTGLWIKKHVPKECLIYSNAYLPELAYYSNHKIEKIDLKDLPENGYLVFFSRKFHFIQNNRLKAVKIFKSKNKKAIIYQIK